MSITSPKEIMAKGTDWRFLDELKRELKCNLTRRRPKRGETTDATFCTVAAIFSPASRRRASAVFYVPQPTFGRPPSRRRKRPSAAGAGYCSVGSA